MKTEYTKGPWKISYSRDGKVALINKGRVATVELDDNIEGEENAHLIAAAPDLLVALELALDILKSKYGYPGYEYFDGVINKARGL